MLLSAPLIGAASKSKPKGQSRAASSDSSSPPVSPQDPSVATTSFNLTSSGMYQGRPRAQSHVQLPLFTPSSSKRPLPAIPISASADSIKVPLEQISRSQSAATAVEPTNHSTLNGRESAVHTGNDKEHSQSSIRLSQSYTRSQQQHGAEYFQSSSVNPSSGNQVYFAPLEVAPLQELWHPETPSSPRELQPYIPPPPPTTSTANPASPPLPPQSQQHPSSQQLLPHHELQLHLHQPQQQQHLIPNPMPKTQSSNIRPSGVNSRRHSAAAGALSIQTSNFSHIRRGPSTADQTLSKPAMYASGSLEKRGQSKRSVESEAALLKGAGRHHLQNAVVAEAATATTSSSAVTHSTALASPTSLSASLPGSSNSSNTGSMSAIALPRSAQGTITTTTTTNMSVQSASDKISSLQHAQAVETIKRSGSGMETNERTAMALMQQYLTLPDDPESSRDIEIQIQISQAAVDAKGFEVLYPHQVEAIKNHHASVSNRITALTSRLALESKIRDAAEALLRLHSHKKKLAEQATEHLDAANRKVDQVATELWKLTQLAAELQRTLLQHTAGVLALGVVRLEDQTRRERDARLAEEHFLLHDSEASQKIAALSKTIQSLEDDAFEAQTLLEDKDRAISRLMKQLDHQQQLFVKLDEQQQKAMALSRSHQQNLEVLGGQNDALMADMRQALDRIGQRLHHIIEQRQIQEKLAGGTAPLGSAYTSSSMSGIRPKEEKPLDGRLSTQESTATTTITTAIAASRPSPQQQARLIHKRSSETALAASLGTNQRSPFSSTTDLGLQTPSSPMGLAQSSSSLIIPNHKQGHSSATVTAVGADSKPPSLSLQAIYAALDSVETHFWQSLQKASYLESELALVRRQSLTLSQSRQNSVRFKDPSPTRRKGGVKTSSPLPASTSSSSSSSAAAAAELTTTTTTTTIATFATGSTTDDPIRAALEKSLKDAILEKEKARQELESERQRWQEDQQQRIKAMEETIAATKQGASSLSMVGSSTTIDHESNGAAVVEIRRQLQEALDEIDRLNAQHQTNLKSMRQLFDIVSESRKNSAAAMGNMSTASLRSVGSSFVGTPSGFSMEVLIVHVKELVVRSQQLEQDNRELHLKLEEVNGLNAMAGKSSSQNHANGSSNSNSHQAPASGGSHLRITKKELEQFQASSLAIQELENELVILKQHTDILLEENARLADLVAMHTTSSSTVANCSSAAAAASPSLSLSSTTTTTSSTATGAKSVQSTDSSHSVVSSSQRSSLDHPADQHHQHPSPTTSTMTVTMTREGRGIREMEEMLRAKDQILRERDQFVRQQDEELQRLRRELTLAHQTLSANGSNSGSGGGGGGRSSSVRRPCHRRGQRAGRSRSGSTTGSDGDESGRTSDDGVSSSSADECLVSKPSSLSQRSVEGTVRTRQHQRRQQRQHQRRRRPSPMMSEFEAKELQEYRVRCGLLEEELGEARMLVAALESAYGGSLRPSTTIQATRHAQQPSPPSAMSSWLSSMGSLSLASLTGSSNGNGSSVTKANEPDTPSSIGTTLDAPPPLPPAGTNVAPLSPNRPSSPWHGDGPENLRHQTGSPVSFSSMEGGGGGPNPFSHQRTVAGATAALRREFRRVMTDLRNEKEQMVRKEVEERRRLEAVVRQLRRELAAAQSEPIGTHNTCIMKVKSAVATDGLDVINNFFVLPLHMPAIPVLSLNSAINKKKAASSYANNVLHYLYYKKHESPKQDEAKTPKGRTLFVLNVPVDSTEDQFRQLFKPYGRVVSVHFLDHRYQDMHLTKEEREEQEELERLEREAELAAQKAEEAAAAKKAGKKAGKNSKQHSQTSTAVTKRRRILRTATQAYVVFLEEQELQKVLQLKKKKRTWISANADGEQDSKHFETLGINKWIQEYRTRRPNHVDLQLKVDDYMDKFERSEYQAQQAALARVNMVDEDGFTLVTSAGKKGSNTDGVITVQAARAEDVKNIKPKKKELQDFYRFQMREAKRDKLVELRRKFEEDKQKIEHLKATRRFKPY
ncbi:Ribosomal RNA-processing protein 7 [Actinomortierella ambigua]|nr:Ribosomal RNA-processing protein 7 [Actinomortierella ambigua]